MKNYRRSSIVLILALLAFLSACGESGKPASQAQDDTNQSGTIPSEVSKVPPNETPLASAGVDQSVSAGTLVILDGSDSLDDEDSVLTYYWTQISGEQVTLDDATAMYPQFTAPNGSSSTQLIFELQVSDGVKSSVSDEVVITINALVADCNNPGWDPSDFETVYRVGPGHSYATPSDVPWENIAPDTLVMIYGRDQPYRDKWVVNVEASAEKPVVVLGVPVNGSLPIISGENAVTRTQLNYWNENRAVIKIGASSTPNNSNASHITIECLDIQSAKPGYVFTDDTGSANQSYSNNAAAITVEQGEHITIKRCDLHDAGNGLFTTSLTSNILISSNHIYDNGIFDHYYEHNSYTESDGIIFEYNHYGPLCSGCTGNNLKDRSTGTIIRYNWIEDGNRQLDLVDTDHDEILNDARYHRTFVYGNVLLEGDGEGNSQMIHYGGDSGDTDYYRKGVLHLYHNTIVSTRSGNTTLVRLSSANESMDARNNIIYNTAGGAYLAMAGSEGQIILSNNWLPSGWRNSHSSFNGNITSFNNLESIEPEFQSLPGQNFHLTANASAINSGTSLSSDADSNLIMSEYVQHQIYKTRLEGSTPTIGAYSAE